LHDAGTLLLLDLGSLLLHDAGTLLTVQSMEDVESEWYQREVIEAELPGEEAIEEEDEDSDPYYFVRQAETGRGDIYLAARTGDVKRVK
jgi:hypothetical protein